MPDILKAGVAKPGRIFGLAVVATVPCNHQPVEREKGCLAGRGLIRLQNKVQDYNTTAECERCEAFSEEVLILDGTEHVANCGDEDQIVIPAEFVALEISRACFHPCRQSRFLNVLFGQWKDRRQIKYISVKFWRRFCEGDREAARASADIQHSPDTAGVHGVYHERCAFRYVADHAGTSALRRDLQQLSGNAGAKLLRALGVTGTIRSCKVPATNLAAIVWKELNYMHELAAALYFAACLGHFERNPAEVNGTASDLIELSTRQNFASWLAGGEVLRGWARSASGKHG